MRPHLVMAHSDPPGVRRFGGRSAEATAHRKARRLLYLMCVATLMALTGYAVRDQHSYAGVPDGFRHDFDRVRAGSIESTLCHVPGARISLGTLDMTEIVWQCSLGPIRTTTSERCSEGFYGDSVVACRVR